MTAKLLGAAVFAIAVSACGPTYAPPNAPALPCPQISLEEAEAALRAGAARGTARVYENGTVWLDNGPGIRHCATFTTAMRPCRRPNDYVISYTFPDETVIHVRVPANEQYRFRVGARPTTCEIVNFAPPGSL